MDHRVRVTLGTAVLSLKGAYTLFLSDTAFAGTAREGNGNAGDTASSAGPEGNGHVDLASYFSNAPPYVRYARFETIETGERASDQ
jgi:hypothetical protein